MATQNVIEEAQKLEAQNLESQIEDVVLMPSNELQDGKYFTRHIKRLNGIHIQRGNTQVTCRGIRRW